MTKREALLLLAMMPFGHAEGAETQDSANSGTLTLYDWKQPVTWTFNLARVKDFAIQRGDKQITVAVDDFWTALGGDAVAR
ncbi:MAG: hypothetical protein M0Z28_18320 [Rhodospirillales bacterium]|nr:hypothetical protein [Rhodospirillales bacterium]